MSDSIREKYPYLYETHLHTTESSACARYSGAEMAKACKEYGYSGIFVTDHNWGGNTAIDRSLPWEEWVEKFCMGYENAKAMGDEIGLDVFFGYEAGYAGTEFLIYGIDKEWLLANPEIWTADVEKQYRLVKAAGGMVIHAHPFREEDYIPQIRLFPELVDGVEAVNAMHSHSKSRAHNDASFDAKAIAYAKEKQLPMTAGSDIHTTDLLGGGIAFKRRITSGADYVKAICSGEDYALTNGECWYDKEGNLITE